MDKRQPGGCVAKTPIRAQYQAKEKTAQHDPAFVGASVHDPLAGAGGLQGKHPSQTGGETPPGAEGDIGRGERRGQETNAEQEQNAEQEREANRRMNAEREDDH